MDLLVDTEYLAFHDIFFQYCSDSYFFTDSDVFLPSLVFVLFASTCLASSLVSFTKKILGTNFPTNGANKTRQLNSWFRFVSKPGN